MAIDNQETPTTTPVDLFPQLFIQIDDAVGALEVVKAEVYRDCSEQSYQIFVAAKGMIIVKEFALQHFRAAYTSWFSRFPILSDCEEVSKLCWEKNSLWDAKIIISENEHGRKIPEIIEHLKQWKSALGAPVNEEEKSTLALLVEKVSSLTAQVMELQKKVTELQQQNTVPWQRINNPLPHMCVGSCVGALAFPVGWVPGSQ